MFFKAKFEHCHLLFGTRKITACHVEFNMAPCCASSNSSDESGAESSDIVSEADISSEDESIESERDSDDLSDEEISALWTRIYPSEPYDLVDNFNI